MSRSFAQTVALPCGSCGHSFMVDIWLIVDATERPDLVERIHAETIHSLRCAHCGAVQPLDAPLLFHDSRAQTLIFAAQADATTEQNQERARQLGQQLIGSIPSGERQPYLARAQIVAGIGELHAALAGVAPQTSDELSAALPALMAALSPAQVQTVAQEHPVLQQAEAIAQLRAYEVQLRSDRHHELADALAQRISVLDATAASPPHPARRLLAALLDAESPEQRQTLLRTEAAAVTPEVATMLAALAEQAQRQQLDAVARDLLVIRDEVLTNLGPNRPTTPSA